MAHAGTSTNLPKQATTSTTNGFLQAVIAAILVLALAAGVVAITSNLAGKTSAVPAANPAYQIQNPGGAVDPHKIVGHRGAMIYQ